MERNMEIICNTHANPEHCSVINERQTNKPHYNVVYRLYQPLRAKLNKQELP